jgi:hypothetical protein
MATGSSRGIFVFWSKFGEGRRPMGSHDCEHEQCDRKAIHRSLYRHALNALELASRSGCASKEARELAERCAEMLRGASYGQALSAGQR